MTISQDIEALRARYEEDPTEDLLRIVHSKPGEYQRVAVEIAESVLRARQVTPEEVRDVLWTVDKERMTKADAAAAPLPGWLKGVCFTFCGPPGILIAAFQSAKGRHRRAKEAWISVALGWAVRIVLIVLLRTT